MEPITREEMYLAAAAGEYSGELPEPKTRLEYYLKKIKEAVENGSSVAPEDIDAAIEAYLNSHDADIVTEQELSDALAGYYDKSDMDTALAGKAAADHNYSGVYAPASHTHAQSDITGLSDALAGKSAVSHSHDDRYYTETEVDTALSGKSIANTPASSGSSPWQSFNNDSGDSFSFGYSGARKDLTITFPPALGYVVVTKITIYKGSNITYNNRDAIIYVGNEEDKVTYKTFNTNAETLNLSPSSAATDFGCNYIAFHSRTLPPESPRA